MSSPALVDERTPLRFKVPHAGGTVGPVAGVEWFVWLEYYAIVETLSVWDEARWDTAGATWEGRPGELNIACDVISLELTFGRDEPLSRFRPASLTITVDDPDGTLSPWSTASDPEQYATIRPGMTLRAEATFAGVTYRQFSGIVQSIADTFPNVSDHHVQFVALDALSILGAYDGLEQSPSGANELAGARLERIFELVRYTGPTDLDAGTVPLQATTLAQNMLNEAGLVTDTELGALFVDGAGVMTFVDRNGLVDTPEYTEPQFVFGEVEPELCYVDIELATDAELVRNIVSISNAGGSAVTRTDEASRALYGDRTYQRFDLIHVDAGESPQIADRYLEFFGDAGRRIEALVVSPVVNPETILAALTIRPLWMVTVRRRATGFQVVADLQVESIAHSITGAEWRTTFRTFSASAVFAVGRWGVAEWNVGLWGF